MLVRLPGRFVFSIYFWKNSHNIIEEHIVDEHSDTFEEMQEKYKDDPTVKVREQYLIRLNKVMVVAYQKVG